MSLLTTGRTKADEGIGLGVRRSGSGIATRCGGLFHSATAFADRALASREPNAAALDCVLNCGIRKIAATVNAVQRRNPFFTEIPRTPPLIKGAARTV
jgi:hypothetical protein